MRIFFIFLLLVSLVPLTGCTSTQKGAVIGALVGGAVGAAIGWKGYDEKNEDAIAGVSVGAPVGAVIGAALGYLAEE